MQLKGGMRKWARCNLAVSVTKIHDEIGEQNVREESSRVYASLTIQDLSDRFRLKVLTILIASAQERIRV